MASKPKAKAKAKAKAKKTTKAPAKARAATTATSTAKLWQVDFDGAWTLERVVVDEQSKITAREAVERIALGNFQLAQALAAADHVSGFAVASALRIAQTKRGARAALVFLEDTVRDLFAPDRDDISDEIDLATEKRRHHARVACEKALRRDVELVVTLLAGHPHASRLQELAALVALGVPETRTALLGALAKRPVAVSAYDVVFLVCARIAHDVPEALRANAREALMSGSIGAAVFLHGVREIDDDAADRIDALLVPRNQAQLDRGLSVRWLSMELGKLAPRATRRGPSTSARVIYLGSGMFLAEDDSRRHFHVRWPDAPVAVGDVVTLQNVVDGIARVVRARDDERTFDARGYPLRE